ncbi:MAG: hypothetical protein IPK81_16170 [Rhodospirillales bacterium]|nr:MAG: hypothetical protein IPK81_16170 [Rhodospirillales bacterium]
MAILRALGWLLVVLTAAAGVADLTDNVETGERSLSVVGQLWARMHAPSLNLVQAVTERYIHPSVWQYLARPVLLTPAVPLFGGLAAVCLAVGYFFRRDPEGGRRRRRRRR